ncbi:acetyl-CoA hydrolase/transferase family protein [Acidipropionibacterium virtanenii]|uniref:Succinyl-CoA:coenzyme A transferase n=1 Tax=Acidipropionibacterium virtanenii TaxID=2057246 RepID=A0A344UUC8_9ACTN|nr:acetyl-CoA hydrolase/transferase C-terminal domain-containing protein [Acidipropionibacterium virtanenii]AXE38876.1 Succinyl-CoA:coenzyme A transferase [Acidipropionibacterium virtanenii]
MRLISIDELDRAVSTLPEAPRIVSPGGGASPLELLGALDARLERWSLFCVNAPEGVPARDGVTHETVFLGPGSRAAGQVRYFPVPLSTAALLFATSCPPDMVVLHTTTPRNHVVSMGVEVQLLVSAVEYAKRRGVPIIAQINPRMPFTRGDAVLADDVIDYAVEVDAPLIPVPPVDLDEEVMSIGELVASRVADGSTIQIGIGKIPDAAAHSLHARRNLRIWTGMITDAAMHLDRAGALVARRQMTGSAVLGSEELYAWADDNPRVRLLRCEKTNNPASISALPAFVSIHSALQVDLFGQVNASRFGDRIYSGTAGSTDFQAGAMHSSGGQSLVALRSRHRETSTIIGQLAGPATYSQPTAVITENGVAELLYHHEAEQAERLIERAAHPDAREELRAQARRHGLL